MTGRLLLAMPLYTDVSVNWFVRFLSVDRSPVIDTLVVRKVYLAAAMTRLFESALSFEAEWDRVVVWEADMMPGRDALTRIANYPDHLDIVGTMYFQHPPPHHPMAFTEHDPHHFHPLAHNQIDHMMTNPGIYPVDGVGFGFTSVHRRVLEKWDHDTYSMFGDPLQVGHDWAFCHNARAQGFGVHIDTGIECGHLTEVAVTYRDNQILRDNA